jgi:hypothetical protein
MNWKTGQLADQNAQARKTGMKPWRRKTAGALTASLGGLVGKESLQNRGDRSPRRRVTNTRMRHHWRSPTVESKIGQRYLGQNQNSGEQDQLENEYHQLPALHGTDRLRQELLPWMASVNGFRVWNGHPCPPPFDFRF